MAKSFSIGISVVELGDQYSFFDSGKKTVEYQILLEIHDT